MKNLKGDKDDTANEDLSVKKQKLLFRNELFDVFVDTEDFLFAALLCDDKKNKLFCGQICEITHSWEENGIDYFLVLFFDFINGDEIVDCLIEKKHLLPLFDMNPALYKKETQEARNQWEDYKVHNITTSLLKPHKKSKNRFEIGQLVTLQLDFKQEMSNDEAFTIQAGQVGMISKILDDVNVEVTFWSIPVGTLASLLDTYTIEKQPSVYASINGSKTSHWEKKIHICKDYLFPLYGEALK